MVALVLMPLQATTCVMAQVAGQVVLGEGGGAVVDQLGRQPTEEPGEERLFGVVGGRPAHERGPEQLGREGDHGTQHGPHAAQGDQEGQHASSAGQRPVEVERSDRCAAAIFDPAVCRGMRLGGQIGHGRFIESLEGGAAPPRPACEAQGAVERLAVVDDGAAAARLVHGRLTLGHSPLLQHRHAIRT